MDLPFTVKVFNFMVKAIGVARGARAPPGRVKKIFDVIYRGKLYVHPHRQSKK